MTDTTQARLTDQEARALTFLATGIRRRLYRAPTWDEAGVYENVIRCRDTGISAAEVILRVIRAAADRDAQTPGVIPKNGRRSRFRRRLQDEARRRRHRDRRRTQGRARTDARAQDRSDTRARRWPSADREPAPHAQRRRRRTSQAHDAPGTIRRSDAIHQEHRGDRMTDPVLHRHRDHRPRPAHPPALRGVHLARGPGRSRHLNLPHTLEFADQQALKIGGYFDRGFTPYPTDWADQRRSLPRHLVGATSSAATPPSTPPC
jgi:hypothetical protein